MRNAINKSAYAPKPQTEQREHGSSGPQAYSAYSNPYRKKTSAPAAGNGVLSYGVGDKVRHKKFGLGTITNIRDGGRDYEVTVDFPAWGVKKMFAAFAKLEKAED
jgi:DNA helicase-2/ATP-dependent DNA helicase PcrA